MELHRVNYFILGELLWILERNEMQHGVSFADIDPDSEEALNQIVHDYIEPVVRAAASKNQEAITRTIAVYTPQP